MFFKRSRVSPALAREPLLRNRSMRTGNNSRLLPIKCAQSEFPFFSSRLPPPLPASPARPPKNPAVPPYSFRFKGRKVALGPRHRHASTSLRENQIARAIFQVATPSDSASLLIPFSHLFFCPYFDPHHHPTAALLALSFYFLTLRFACFRVKIRIKTSPFVIFVDFISVQLRKERKNRPNCRTLNIFTYYCSLSTKSASLLEISMISLLLESYFKDLLILQRVLLAMI
jgi:hypothetical protein